LDAVARLGGFFLLRLLLKHGVFKNRVTYTCMMRDE
jgi:hypothetical protein